MSTNVPNYVTVFDLMSELLCTTNVASGNAFASIIQIKRDNVFKVHNHTYSSSVFTFLTHFEQYICIIR